MKKSDILFSEYWHELDKEMRARGIEPDNTPFLNQAQQVAEMVGAMLLEKDLIIFLYGAYLNLLNPPHKDYGKIIKAAKQAGTFPEIECKIRGTEVIEDSPSGSEAVN